MKISRMIGVAGRLAEPDRVTDGKAFRSLPLHYPPADTDETTRLAAAKMALLTSG